MSTLTTQLKSDIDKLWTEFWTGRHHQPAHGHRADLVPDVRPPARHDRDDGREQGGASQEALHGALQRSRTIPVAGRTSSRRTPPRCSRVVRDEVFPHFRKLNGGTTFAEYMKDAQLMIQKPSLLVSAVNMIDELPLTEGDTKGDLYEYLLSKLTTAGINGQFRTPRHIIRLMVDLLEPKPTEVDRRPGLRHGGLPRRRDAAPAGELHLAEGQAQGRETARRSTRATCWSRTASTSRAACSTASTSTRRCSASPP